MSSELRQRKPAAKAEVSKVSEDASKKTPMEIAQEKYRKFFTRTIWGSLMIGVFGAILYSDHVLVSLFVVLLQIIVFKEMISLRYIEAKEKNLWGFRTLHWYFLFVTFYWLYGSSTLLQLSQVLRLGLLDSLSRSHLASAFAFYVIGFIAFIMTLQKDLYKYQFGQLTWTLMTLLIVIGQSHFIIQNIFKGLFWLLLPASLIICNDIMAYFCGLLFGRRFVDRPLTSLSPNKTWEGFVGAFICTCTFSFFFAYFLSQFEWFICPKVFTSQTDFFEPLHCTPSATFLPQTYELPATLANLAGRFGVSQTSFELIPVQFHALVFALFASLIAPFGGFFASGIKRAYGIKDFDSLFPGHGGMTDRMDCQFIMGMFTYVYCRVFIASTMMDASHVLELISHLTIEDQWVIFKQLNNTLMEAA